MHIETASAAAAQGHLDQLRDLLIRTVDGGASIGWVPPMQAVDAESYWHGRFAAVGEGSCVLLLVWEGENLIGTAQLRLEQRENGNHRAEVQKVIVDADYRRRGVGEQLMRALEDCAAQHQRTLLFLDTRQGDAGENLYLKVGYVKAGVIPEYARNAEGGFDATVLYYKILR